MHRKQGTINLGQVLLLPEASPVIKEMDANLSAESATKKIIIAEQVFKRQAQNHYNVSKHNYDRLH